jgi:ornithine cyclodeaminase
VVLLLDRKAICSVFTMRDAIEADKRAFVLHSERRTQVPLRSTLDVGKGKGQCLFMPAYAEEVEQAGVKIVSVFPGNAQKGKPVVPATMILLDGETGEVDALLDGTVLTQMRTAAISGAATELLARPDASTAALFGTGGQAEAQLEALLTVRALKKVFVFDVRGTHGTPGGALRRDALRRSLLRRGRRGGAGHHGGDHLADSRLRREPRRAGYPRERRGGLPAGHAGT